MLVGMEWHHYAPTEIVFVDEQNEIYQEMRSELAKYYLPRKVVVRSSAIGGSDFIKSLETKEGKLTVYFCTNQTCELPITDVEGLRTLLEKTRWKSE